MTRARAADVVAPIAPGETLADKYRVERILGKGGMGVVVAARHLQLEERVAIKFLHAEAAEDPVVVARFVREARAAAKIRSEHVARVFDVGTLEGGTPYIVMEYLEGSDLGALLAASSQACLPVDVAIDYVLQACEALAEAHVRGIVHRDLKPANLFVTRRADGSPCVKVLDFGISKSMTAASGGNGVVTNTSAIMGSPNYMSPEQLSAPRDVDGRADIWSLGVLLFELVSGQQPFTAEALPQLCTMILHSPAPALRTVFPGAPEALETFVFRCLEKDREKRFATIGELAVALARLGPARARLSAERASRVSSPDGVDNGPAPPTGSGAEVQHTVFAPLEKRVEEPARGTVTDWGQTAPGEGRGRATRIMIIAAAALAAVVVGLAMRGRPDGASAARQPPQTPIAAGAPRALTEIPTATALPEASPAPTLRAEGHVAMARTEAPQLRVAPKPSPALATAPGTASAWPRDKTARSPTPPAANTPEPTARPALPDDRL